MEMSDCPMIEVIMSSLANIMQDIVTESIQLETIKDGSVWIPHDTVSACPLPADIMQDIVTESIQLQNIKDVSVWLPHNSVLACPPWLTLYKILWQILNYYRLSRMEVSGCPMIQVSMSSLGLANIMQDIVTESIQLQITKESSV